MALIPVDLSKSRRADLIKNLQAKSKVIEEKADERVPESAVPITPIKLFADSASSTPFPADTARSAVSESSSPPEKRPFFVPPLPSVGASSSQDLTDSAVKASLEPLSVPASRAKSNFKEQAFLYLKPRANSKEVLALVERCLSVHNITVAARGSLNGREIAMRGIFDWQYSTLKRYAEDVDPLEIVASPDMRRIFKNTFNVEWNSVRDNSQLSNAKDACDYLEVDDFALHSMCLHSKLSTVRLLRGVYVSCLDASSTSDPALKRKLQLPIYVINGFYGSMKEAYESPATTIHYLLLEWEASQLSWKDMLFEVVGDRVPSLAKRSSIRGTAYHQWKDLKMHAQPNSKDNCLHVSASALEALAEKFTWLNTKSKSIVLQTDVLGAQFLAAQIPHHVLQKWFANPLINGQFVFDLMNGLGIEQCLEKATVLTGNNHPQLFIYLIILFEYYWSLGAPAKKKQKLIERLNASAKKSSTDSPVSTQRSAVKPSMDTSRTDTPAKREDHLQKSQSVRIDLSEQHIPPREVLASTIGMGSEDDDDDDDFDPFEEIRKMGNDTRPNTSASTLASATVNSARSDTSTSTAFRGGTVLLMPESVF